MTRLATTSEVKEVLEDYKIHLTGYDSTADTLSPAQVKVGNPPHWPTEHRRIPNYRPVDRNRDVEGRPNGENFFERVFLTIMFTGVVMNATVAKIWGATGGPYFPGLFKYAIGGEW